MKTEGLIVFDEGKRMKAALEQAEMIILKKTA